MYGRKELELYYKTSCTKDAEVFYSKEECRKWCKGNALLTTTEESSAVDKEK